MGFSAHTYQHWDRLTILQQMYEITLFHDFTGKGLKQPKRHSQATVGVLWRLVNGNTRSWSSSKYKMEWFLRWWLNRKAKLKTPWIVCCPLQDENIHTYIHTYVKHREHFHNSTQETGAHNWCWNNNGRDGRFTFYYKSFSDFWILNMVISMFLRQTQKQRSFEENHGETVSNLIPSRKGK